MEIPACCTCGIRTRPGHTILDEEGEDQVVARSICGACVVKLVADVERVGMALRVQEVDPAGGGYPLASRSRPGPLSDDVTPPVTGADRSRGRRNM